MSYRWMHRLRGKSLYFVIFFIVGFGTMLGSASYLAILGYIQTRQKDEPIQKKPLFFNELSEKDFSTSLTQVVFSSEFPSQHWIHSYTVWIPKLPFTYAQYRQDDRSPWHTLPVLFIPSVTCDTDRINIDKDVALGLRAQLYPIEQSVVEKKFTVRVENLNNKTMFIIFLDYPTVNLAESPAQKITNPPILYPIQREGKTEIK